MKKIKTDAGELGEKILDMLIEEIDKLEEGPEQDMLADIYQKAGRIVFDYFPKITKGNKDGKD